MTSRVFDNKLTYTNVKIDLSVYLLVVFLTLSPILSFLTSYGINGAVSYAIIAVLLYVPLIAGLVTKKVVLNKACFILFVVTFLYVLICFQRITIFKDIYLSETNGVFARILTFTSSIFGLIFFGIHYTADEFKKGIKIASYINLVISIFRFFFVTIKGQEFLTYGYDMNFGYTLLFPLLCFLSLFVLERKIIYLFISLFSFFFILLFGSRGPVLCVGIYVFLLFCFVIFKKLTTSKKVLSFFLIILLGLIVYLLICFVVPLLDFSLLPRSLRYILSIDYFSSSTDSGRRIIVNDLNSYLNNIPLFGYGLLADQGFLGIGKYSHNIFLEMWITFGPIISVSIIVLLALLSLRVLLNKRINPTFKLFFIALWSFSFGRLIVSNSFWYETYFWCLIAFGLCIISKKNANEKFR